MITITESIEYFFEVDYDMPDKALEYLDWDDLTDIPELYEQVSAKMNGDYMRSFEITVDEIRPELSPVLTRTSDEEPALNTFIFNKKQTIRKK